MAIHVNFKYIIILFLRNKLYLLTSTDIFYSSEKQVYLFCSYLIRFVFTNIRQDLYSIRIQNKFG
jgi:hypothetical protein